MAPWFEQFAAVLAAAIAVLAVYAGLFAVFALRRPRTPPAALPRHRFALVIAARNEEQVIGHLLDSLAAQDYPAELFDVFVIADNCTDATAQVCLHQGARVYERFNRVQVGKGYALGWFFNRHFLPKFGKIYDAVGIFDADNLVDSRFLRVMNDHLCAGETSAMGYRDAKNPHDNWISAGFALGFWTKTRMHNLPRTNLGLSALAGGTGYVFKTDLIADGWKTTTLGEDIQFTMQINGRGHRMAQAMDAVFYDEQTTSLRMSVRQRLRWTTGSYQNFLACSPALIKGLFSHPLLSLDALLYLLFPPLIAINLLIQVIYRCFQIFAQPGILLGLGISVAAGFLICMLQGLIVLLLEKKFCRRTLKYLLSYPLFLLTTNIIAVGALFNFRPSWRPIHHKRDISIKELTIAGSEQRELSKIS